MTNVKPGRPAGAKNKRTHVRDAIKTVFGGDGETAFWMAVATQAKNGDSVSVALIANRLEPALKPVFEKVAFDMPAGATLTEQAKVIVTAMANANVSPDVAVSLINALANVARVEELDDLKRQLDELKRTISSRGY